MDYDHHTIEMLDSVTRAAGDALKLHVGGVTTSPTIQFSDAGWKHATRYDDRSDAIVTVKLADGFIADYRPRFDGEYVAWKARMESPRPHLAAVEAVSA